MKIWHEVWDYVKMIIIVVAVVAFVMRSTVFGNEIYFLGSNAKASRYSGINTLRVTIMTHMFSGILGGVSGILITSHLNSAKSSNGSTYTLLTLLIVVLGGIHPDGGKGRVTGVALATILLQMIANAFGLLHMDDNAKTFVNGCLLVAALLLDVYLDKRAAKKLISNLNEERCVLHHENNQSEKTDKRGICPVRRGTYH